MPALWTTRLVTKSRISKTGDVTRAMKTQLHLLQEYSTRGVYLSIILASYTRNEAPTRDTMTSCYANKGVTQ